MKLLLDTCVFLWVLTDDKALSGQPREWIADPENEIFLSSISAWEIIVKYSLGRLSLPESPHLFLPRQRLLHGIESLPLHEEAVLQLNRLPDYHKDPFDRMLICQAIMHGMPILTPDAAINRYPVRTMW